MRESNQDPSNGRKAADATGELTRQDMGMIAAEIKRNPDRWDLPARQAIMAKVQRLALATESDRTLLSAARLIAQLEAQNQADQHKAEPDLLQVRTQPMTNDQQRAAILAMLIAERDKR